MQRSLKTGKISIRRANLTDIRFLFNIYNQNIENGFFFFEKKDKLFRSQDLVRQKYIKNPNFYMY